MIRASIETPTNEPRFVIEDVTDLGEIARHRAQGEQFARNSDWLAAHWPELLPKAQGKFVAVAAQEAFIADTAEAGWAWAAARHPQDGGALVRYVNPAQGPRIYANSRHLAPVR